MIAEIHSKISSTGSNISDRSEDQLTGNVFGTLRYLPFSTGLKHVLERVEFESKELKEEFLGELLAVPEDSWVGSCKFWPQHEIGEIDLLFDFPNFVIGIEVKLHSGLSSEDDVNNAGKNKEDFKSSDNQLAKETKIVESHCEDGKKRGWLILLAKQGEGNLIVADVRKRELIKNGIPLGVLSWTSVLDAVLAACSDEQLPSYQKIILEDLIHLLKKKNFRRFRSFEVKIERYVQIGGHFEFKVPRKLFSFVCSCNVKPNGYFKFSS